jgi:hypothetical protein
MVALVVMVLGLYCLCCSTGSMGGTKVVLHGGTGSNGTRVVLFVL